VIVTFEAEDDVELDLLGDLLEEVLVAPATPLKLPGRPNEGKGLLAGSLSSNYQLAQWALLRNSPVGDDADIGLFARNLCSCLASSKSDNSLRR